MSKGPGKAHTLVHKLGALGLWLSLYFTVQPKYAVPAGCIATFYMYMNSLKQMRGFCALQSYCKCLWVTKSFDS